MQLNVGETIFHNWIIKRVIGEGSFGVVYELERPELGYTYKAAAKVISIPKNRSEYMDALDEGMSQENVTEYYRSMVEDIISECVILEKMKGDSHIVSYEDHEIVEEEDGIGWNIFIRMELLTPLAVHMKQNPFREPDIVQLGIDICRGLETCALQNVIHRDIKPENIFVSNTMNYKLGDFGISRTMERSEMAVSKKGTQMYMAPEVYRGEQYDATVDIYSLGLVLYRLMNDNRIPFLPPLPYAIRYSDREEALKRRINGEQIPAPIHASAAFSEVILTACRFDPKERYRTPKDMRRALEKVLEELEKVEVDGPKTEPTWHPVPNPLDDKDITIERETPIGGGGILGEEETSRENNGEEKEEKTVSMYAQEKEETVSMYAQVVEEKNEEKNEEKKENELRLATGSRYSVSRGKQVAMGMEAARKEEENKQEEEQKKPTVSYQSSKSFDFDIKKILLIAVGLVAVVVIVAFAISGVRVPDVSGLTLADAQTALADAKLMAGHIDYAFSADIPKDYVVSSTNVGDKVKKNSPVDLVVSKGPENVVMLDLINQGQEDAQASIQSLNMDIKVTVQDGYSLTIAKGTVCAQKPQAGEPLENGAEVVLYISKGALSMPDVVGKTQDEAMSLFAGYGITPTLQETYNKDVETGKIASQSVEAGTSIDGTVEIVLEVSMGVEMLTVPNVVNLTQDEAVEALKNAGFSKKKIKVVTEYNNTVAAGNVISQETAEGNQVEKGSSITIHVSLGVKPVQKQSTTEAKKKSGWEWDVID